MQDLLFRLSTVILCYLCCCFLLLPGGLHTVHAETDPAAEHTHYPETVWTCSMHPQIQLPESGQCLSVLWI
ncbi:hypothetical protein H206_02346 [Candidatus Electrothrix aarhusensis]|uniref:Uncharacterized protein n=1 Tax=Candidatus Electrothrix aarhusensis TaxID=1859131 RepID=A0A3S3R473_9BACT|nr:hypothetical protein H206_02346 [Candidatus Electrothrix aarhusensis]